MRENSEGSVVRVVYCIAMLGSVSAIYPSALWYGYAMRQGRRDRMEDTLTEPASLPQRPEAQFFGVFDGHGGSIAASLACRYLASYIPSDKPMTHTAWHKVFSACDTKICRDTYDGTCAVAACVEKKRVSCAWVGDCMLLHVRDGKVIYQTVPHNLDNTKERRRVIKAKAEIRGQHLYIPYGRGLNITRSLGDVDFKKGWWPFVWRHLMLSKPDVYEATLQKKDLLILYSDGLTDNHHDAYGQLRSPQGIADLASCDDILQEVSPIIAPLAGPYEGFHREGGNNKNLQSIAQRLCDSAYDREKGRSGDNITVLLIAAAQQ